MSRFRPLVWPAVIIVLSATVYLARIQKEMVDFKVYRTAAERALAGAPLYRPQDGHYQFKYLPAFAFVAAPFARVDLEIGKVIWFGLSVGLLCALVRWSVRALPERRRTERALIWLSILLMGKFYVRELVLGQTNILFATLLLGALLAAQVDQRRLAGALVGIGIFVKPYAIVLLPWLALSAGASGVLVAATVLAIGLGLPAVVYGWTGNIDQVLGWYRTVTDTTAPNLLVAENVSLATMWTKWLGNGLLATRLAIATGVAVVGLVVAVLLRRRKVSEPNYLEFGMLMLLVPLLSPQGWDYVLLIATPAVICLVDRLGDMSAAWKVTTIAALGFMSFTIFDLVGRTLYMWLMSISIISICALVLAASLTHLRWRRLA